MRRNDSRSTLPGMEPEQRERPERWTETGWRHEPCPIGGVEERGLEADRAVVLIAAHSCQAGAVPRQSQRGVRVERAVR